ncbi:MAG: hypothetical protein HQK87_04955 [Nitrospinae bacterium]|nr:hypothetical protein [Nitrospinota bacterium]
MNRTSVFLLLCALFVGACATKPLGIPAPVKIAPETVGGIKEGGTTRAELLKQFGEPEMKIPTEEGMTYFWKDPDLNSLWVLFAEDWTVREYEVSH